MSEVLQLIEDLQRLCSLPEPTASDVFTAGRLVMDLGYYDLGRYPRFDLIAASKQVGQLYRSLLARYPQDARCLNDLGALLLSCGEVEEGRRLALLALAAAPGVRTVHENVRIADIYCKVSPFHPVPPLGESDTFLLAYFDPHAH